MISSPAISGYVMIDVLRRAREELQAETSLIEFTKQAFSIIEPGVEFKDNWHLHAISDHLEAVSNGEIDNLIINIPPGCMKSILVSVAWPAWEWLNDPSLRYLGASYGADLAIRDAMKCRDIITSDWYQARWPGVQIKRGEDQKLKYALTKGGWRMATSVGGRATGEHPDRKLIDDPHNAKQAESDAERNSALTWFDRTLSTRGESRGAKTVIVMQRLHESDMTGHVLADNADGEYELLCLPMEYEAKPKTTVDMGARDPERQTSIGWRDPREKEGQLLWPEMFADKSVRKLKKRLGEYGSAGQLQQRPAPEGGGILKVDHFQKWPHTSKIPSFELVVQSYDTAFTEDTINDPTACSVWGLFRWKNLKCAMLVDAWSEHLSYPKLRTRAIRDWHATYGGDEADPMRSKPRKTDLVIVEKKASGQSLIQDLNAAQVPFFAYNPGNADKISRAHQSAPVLELDCLFIPESKKTPGHFVSWAQPFVRQLERFPNDQHDDYVDTFTQFIIRSRDEGWFDLDVADADPVEEVDYRAKKKRKRNPYS